MESLEKTVLLISPDREFRSAVSAALHKSFPACHISAVENFAAARRTVADFSFDVIVLQDSQPDSLADASPCASPLEDIVTALGGFAPIVVLGGREAPPGLSALIAAGAADFIADAQSHLSEAAACVKKRLESARRHSEGLFCATSAEGAEIRYRDTFGEILRHELNNPLTGILGNAELLLAEARRQKAVPLSENNFKRLETIAALAVRMRETVRRLSQACEVRSEQARSA